MIDCQMITLLPEKLKKKDDRIIYGEAISIATYSLILFRNMTRSAQNMLQLRTVLWYCCNLILLLKKLHFWSLVSFQILEIAENVEV